MPVEFIFDRFHQAARHAARARYLRANGWNPIERSAWVISPRDMGPISENESLDREFAGSRIFFGAKFIVLTTNFIEQAAMLAKLDPVFIYLYPSTLDGLLRVFENTGQRFSSLRRIFTGAEVLDDSLRQRARQLLGVETADNYGSTECFIAWQCPKGSYHINAEHVFVEIVDEAGRQTAPGEMGRVLITTLENHLMPLVRYEIGDYAIAAEGSCPCGRTLPLLGRIAGRTINLFRMQNGSLFSPWALTGPLRTCSEITQFQVVRKPSIS